MPEGWVWTTLGDCTINRDNERIPVSSSIRKKQTSKIFDYYGAAGVIDKVDAYLFDERLLLIGEDGANLLSRSKNNAFFADGKYWVNNHAHILDSCPKQILDYIALVVNSMRLDDYITGSAQPKLSQDNLHKILIPLPPLSEQQCIINRVEELECFIKNIETNSYDLQNTIKQAKSRILELAIHGKLVPQDPNDEPAIELLKRINPKAEITCDNAHYEQLPKGWAACKLEDIIEYEQPQAYIVSSTDYNDSYSTPVLTAGKSFVIGYTQESFGTCDKLPVIIFDDFTTDSKYVDFPFKVKSSAMKILHARSMNVNLMYISYYMKITRLTGDTHKRYWISEYSKLEIMLPPKEEQNKIVERVVNIFSVLDRIAEGL